MNESKDGVFFGELLMRLATKRYERFVQAREFEVGYTGAEANAAVSLAHFGFGAHLVSVVPDTEIGEASINFIRQFGVHTDFVLRGGKRLGTFYLETGASQRPS
jgi:2-dehydro-3-deoxygluconokinase